jgi:hypothetical protein
MSRQSASITLASQKGLCRTARLIRDSITGKHTCDFINAVHWRQGDDIRSGDVATHVLFHAPMMRPKRCNLG